MTIQPKQTPKLAAPASYEASVDFYFWGLKGEHKVDVKEICGNKKVVQMQTQARQKTYSFQFLL